MPVPAPVPNPPRLFAEVVQDSTVHGHIIVYWDGDPPTEEDFEIISLVLDAICLRIASRIKSMGSWNLALSTKLEDLLAPNTPPHLERLACEAISGTMQPEYTVCVAHHRRPGFPAGFCRIRRS